MTDPAPARMVSVQDALAEIEEHLLYSTPNVQRCRICGGNGWYGSPVQHKSDCQFAIVTAALSPTPVSPAPAPASAELRVLVDLGNPAVRLMHNPTGCYVEVSVKRTQPKNLALARQFLAQALAPAPAEGE